MNIQFNFQRFSALLKRDFSVHYRKLPLFAAGLGAFLLLILGIEMTNDHYTINNPMLMQELYSVTLMGLGLVFTSFMFREMYPASNKQFYLLIPASSFEKLLSKWLLSSIGYVIICTLLFYVLYPVVLLLQQVLGVSGSYQFNPFSGDTWLVLKVYLLVQPLYLLGAAAFDRYALPYTILSMNVIAIGMGLLWAVVGYLLIGNIEAPVHGTYVDIRPFGRLEDFAQTALGSALLWLSVFIPGLLSLLVAYFKIKEKEV